MGAFDKIKAGLEEAVAFERGELKAKSRTMTVQPICRFNAAEIREIRKSAGMTQTLFAKFMGVSVKTVEAWECGRNQPIGAACRLLFLTKADPLFPQKAGIVVS